MSGSTIDLEGEPIYSSLRRPGLRARYEYQCRHVLYGRGCGVSKDAHEFASTITAVTGGLSVEVSGASGAGAADHFNGGMLVAEDGSARFITAQSGSVVTISRPIRTLAATQTVKLYPGCNRQIATCEAKFSNMVNFGGFPWIPNKNPFGGSSII